MNTLNKSIIKTIKGDNNMNTINKGDTTMERKYMDIYDAMLHTSGEDVEDLQWGVNIFGTKDSLHNEIYDTKEVNGIEIYTQMGYYNAVADGVCKDYGSYKAYRRHASHDHDYWDRQDAMVEDYHYFSGNYYDYDEGYTDYN